MKSFLLIGFVIISLFVVESDSMDFCDAFEDNGNGIDYTLDFRYFNESKEKSKVVFIIGYDYWLINDNDLDFLRFESNDSAVSDVFGDHYSTVFSVYRRTPRSFEYGFLRKNDSNIEWKAMNDSLNFNTTPNEVLKTTPIDLPKEIQSINNQRLLTFEYFGSKKEFRVFVGQKQILNLEITRFERTYVSFDFKNAFEGTPQQTKKQSVVNHSEGDSNLIGVISGVVYNKTATNLVFFQKNQIIEYCFQDLTELLNYSLESPCLSERKVLINCWKMPWLLLVLVLAVVVGVCILIAICCCYVCRHRFRYFGSEPSAQNIDDYNSKRSKRNGQSMVGIQDSSTVKTVDTNTGLPVNQMTGHSVKNQKSQQISQKKTKTSPPLKSTKKESPKN